MKRPESLDMEAIRTFVTGIELGNFTLAAKQLSRSTSAVSAQLKKLECQCGIKLLHKNGCQRRLKIDPLNGVIADLKLTHPCS